MAETFLRSPFISVEKITEQAEGGVEVSERSLDPTEDSCMNSRMLWLVCRIETKKTTEEIFDLLCDPMLAKGHRRLSVRRGCNKDAVLALIHKADQAKVELGALPKLVRPVASFEILKPGLGKAGARAIEDFVRAWFKDYSQITSNFAVEPLEKDDDDVDGSPSIDEVYADMAPLSERQYLLSIAQVKQKSPNDRNSMERMKLKAKSELSALRTIDKKEAKANAEIESNDCYQPVTGEGLHMPTDFEGVDKWIGETWDPETKQKRSMSFLHYLNSAEHLERTAVLYSDAGSGKTPASKATARTFAVRYQPASSRIISWLARPTVSRPRTGRAWFRRAPHV